MRHLDPTGTVLMLIVGFGWGKPMPVNPTRLRNGPETGRAMVAAAGPVSNLLLATLAARCRCTWASSTGAAPSSIPRSVSSWGFDDYAGALPELR